MGSAAYIEHLWSKADAILIKRRLGLSPITLEMILFLEENKDLWNISDIVEASNRRLDKNRDSYAKKRIEMNAEMEDLSNLIVYL